MRILATLSLCLAMSSCTMVNAQKGTLLTMGDSTGFKADWKNGKMTHLEWTQMQHSIATNAIAGGISQGIMSAGAAIMMGKAPGAITSVIHK